MFEPANDDAEPRVLSEICNGDISKLDLFSWHIIEIRAISCCFRKLVGGAVPNSLLDLIRRFLPICIIEHICQALG